jgi:hypothetical protein
MEIKVINHNDFPLYGRYNGETYEFLPEKPTFLSGDAARHIFGFGVEDKTQALNMLGLLRPGHDSLTDALSSLAKVAFLEGKTVYDENEQGEESAARPRTGERPHATGAGGEPGARGQSLRVPANPRA